MQPILAAFLTAPRTFEIREVPRPRVSSEEALIRVEACGICGTDVEEFNKGPRDGSAAQIIGHEAVGVIDEIGEGAAKRRGLKVGDRVAVDPFVPCAICRFCLAGHSEQCIGSQKDPTYVSRYMGSFATLTQTQWSDLASGRVEQKRPFLFGGYATHMFVTPLTVLHPVPPSVGPRLAALFNPLGGGIKWAVDTPGTTLGSTVVVLGCGQRGLGALIASRQAGAALVVVTGLTRDKHKLDLALEFGATAVVDVEREDLVARVMDLTMGLGVDVVVDTTPQATQPLLDAIRIIRPGGVISIGGLKRAVPSFPIDDARRKAAVIKGNIGVGADAYRRALQMIAAGNIPFHKLQTHSFSLAEAARACQVLAGEDSAEHAVNIVITP